MATEIKTWQIVNGTLTHVKTSLTENNRKEREHLEVWIKSNPEILGSDIAIIGEQVQTKSGPLDFLGIDENGNIVIIELKRDKLAREVLAQAIDYASDAASWDVNRLNEICDKFSGQSLIDYFTGKFPIKQIEDLAINQSQRLILVGFAVEEPLSRMLEWLSTNYNLGINAIILNYVITSSGDELLSRTVIIPEEVEREKSNKKKFTIEMSNEQGNYDIETLKNQLMFYLSKPNISRQRMRDFFLPTLITKGMVSRVQMRKEFVKLGAAADESLAGYYLSLISVQLGLKRNDYLRQIISYDFPNNDWEKDNFKIGERYLELVKEVLQKLKTNKVQSEVIN
ncbi:endonuclease NucS domain-containing protein [Mucilaginibacter arboris]|uniref:DUF91 domain-containing protein n=1 Tax=Mucilaginibacter arboris TaxID=2682090 RepID=A0A7K1T0L6_9SPHI|nr:endonuclease NucS domain-containing protein [Mucilaginibacter arboris]MVN23103.1 DUF91 domain-containing protein [Mucilaginibacter arboris]